MFRFYAFVWVEIKHWIILTWIFLRQENEKDNLRWMNIESKFWYRIF